MAIFKKVREKELATLIISTSVIAVLFILSSYLFRNYEPHIEAMIGLRSLAGMLLYVLVFVLSIVLVPISAMPLIPLGSKLWGVPVTTALSTVGWTLGAMIAFHLARKFGRPFVARLIRTEQIDRMEKMMPEKNIFLTIFFLRTVTPFDGLSYALGLVTRVRPKTFFWATFLGLIPFCFVIAFLGSLPVIFLVCGLALACLFFIIGIYRMKIINGLINNETSMKKFLFPSAAKIIIALLFSAGAFFFRIFPILQPYSPKIGAEYAGPLHIFNSLYYVFFDPYMQPALYWLTYAFIAIYLAIFYVLACSAVYLIKKVLNKK